MWDSGVPHSWHWVWERRLYKSISLTHNHFGRLFLSEREMCPIVSVLENCSFSINFNKPPFHDLVVRIIFQSLRTSAREIRRLSRMIFIYFRLHSPRYQKHSSNMNRAEGHQFVSTEIVFIHAPCPFPMPHVPLLMQRLMQSDFVSMATIHVHVSMDQPKRKCKFWCESHSTTCHTK